MQLNANYQRYSASYTVFTGNHGLGHLSLHYGADPGRNLQLSILEDCHEGRRNILVVHYCLSSRLSFFGFTLS